ncbi:DUF2059 domain-containing protein [Victivallis vadensis]|uniref:DUF2059 domain-containing protein n=1 Tax=Victivallis vadensis TaxID=172901 RepID=UPI0023F2B814|nr:DUF2059 domain-containing protein [Victivallis vadensis]
MKFAILCAAVSLSFSLTAAEYSAADRALAIELLKADGTEQVLDQTFNSALTQMSPKDSDPARPVIERYLKKCFSFEVLKEDLATIYLDNYTVDELKGLIAFYRTPLGRKKAAADPRIGAATAKVTSLKIQENLPLLQRELQKALKK